MTSLVVAMTHEITGSVRTYESLENYDDYIGATLSTILSLHSKLPIAESILVFLTGQDEIEGMGLKSIFDPRFLPGYGFFYPVYLGCQ